MDVNSEKEYEEPVGCLGFAVGLLSFIPGLGLVFGLVGLVWGFKVNNLLLKWTAIVSIVLNVLGLSFMYYKNYVEVGGQMDTKREQIAKQNMYNLVPLIEAHKAKTYFYPKSLKTIAYQLPKAQRGIVFDATQWTSRSNMELDLNKENLILHYEIIGADEGFHLRARGRDGKLNTEDDVLIGPVEGTGFVHKH